MDTRLQVERFDYVRLGERLAVVRLLAGLQSELGAPAGATLVVTDGRHEMESSPARLCKLERRRRLPGRLPLLWSARFAVALELVEYPSVLFELATPGCCPLTMPIPDLRVLTAADAEEIRNLWPLVARTRQRVVVAATTLAVTAGSTPAISLAASGAGQTTTSLGASRPHGPGKLGVPSKLHLVETSVSPPKLGQPKLTKLKVKLPKVTPPKAVPPKVVPPTPAPPKAVPPKAVPQTPAPPKAVPPKVVPPTPVPPKAVPPKVVQLTVTQPKHKLSLTIVTPAPTKGATGKHAGAPAGGHGKAPHPGRHTREPQHPTGGVAIAPTPRPAPRPHVSKPAATAPTTSSLPVTPVPSTLTPAADEAREIAFSRLSALLANGTQPPGFLIPIYKAASRRYHVPWRILAAINSIESNYGRNLSVSSAGALGWMQFMPATWQEYGLAVGRDGRPTGRRPNPYDPRDAIFSAARYLAVNGARHDLRGAIFHYNHATWYVDEVVATAAAISDKAHRPGRVDRRKLGAMEATALVLSGEPYIWGGGHGGWQRAAGYDCSGFVSAVLHSAGYLSAPATTAALPSQPRILPGPGRYVTMFDRTGVSSGQGHVIIEINGQWWESGGSATGGGGPSVHRIRNISPAYLATFNTILHPKGL